MESTSAATDSREVEPTWGAATLKEAQAAHYLGMSIRFVRAERARGAIRFVRMGRSVRYRPADLDAYLAEHVVREAG